MVIQNKKVKPFYLGEFRLYSLLNSLQFSIVELIFYVILPFIYIYKKSLSLK